MSLTGFSLIVAGLHSLSVLSDRLCQAVVCIAVDASIFRKP
jgi:hypothetical protein